MLYPGNLRFGIMFDKLNSYIIIIDSFDETDVFEINETFHDFKILSGFEINFVHLITVMPRISLDCCDVISL